MVARVSPAAGQAYSWARNECSLDGCVDCGRVDCRSGRRRCCAGGGGAGKRDGGARGGGGAFAVLWVLVGVFVARRPRTGPVGPLLVAVGLAAAFTATREVAWHVLAARPDTAARLDRLVAVLAESSVWLFVALALLLAYFPDGRLAGRA